MRRPMIWVAGILFALFLIVRLVAGDRMDKNYYSLDAILEENRQAQAQVQGTLDHIDAKPKSYYFYLKKVSVTLTNKEKIYYFSDFLAIVSQCRKDSYQPGNTLQFSGSLQTFTSPTNPGQFDERSYYKEKNIYYKLSADTCQIKDSGRNVLLAALYQGRDTLKQTYENCLPRKEAGILSAMLLGDKSALDMDVRELYQTAGIGHLLAISGLHISILCMALYEGLRWLLWEKICGETAHLPLPLKKSPFLFTVIFLLAYGKMTGFGISTSRAVIMMLVYLLGREWGKSYDAFTAMAGSAMIIWLQNPYAVFSCSFLLSYSAMAGIYLVLPALEVFFRGTEEEQRADLGKKRRKERELLAEGIRGRIIVFLLGAKDKILSSLLCSLAIWLATLPVLCYFFYEYPTYGMVLNLFVLPLATVLVITAMAGGLVGVVFLPGGKLILWIARGILFFYENICKVFQKLPHPIQIIGRPKEISIFIYYMFLIALCLVLLKGIYRRKGFVRYSRCVMFCCLFLGMRILLFRENTEGFSCTVMDVGQGDGILLRTEAGQTILVDGGSTSVSQVGKYRIIPFLKYYGLSHIDYMIMTHEDEDHISGQRELLESGRAEGISIGCILLPEPDSASVGENYHRMEELAERGQIPCRKLHRGDGLSLGLLQITCLHPEKGFVADSPNAYSTTLAVRYGERSLLLTGDLEKNGEEAVLSSLGRYDILKVAHHGSKNSSSEAYLEKIQPETALISCGEKNRYGHPHKELLERLSAWTHRLYRTDIQGAVFLQTEGAYWNISTYR